MQKMRGNGFIPFNDVKVRCFARVHVWCLSGHRLYCDQNVRRVGGKWQRTCFQGLLTIPSTTFRHQMISKVSIVLNYVNVGKRGHQIGRIWVIVQSAHHGQVSYGWHFLRTSWRHFVRMPFLRTWILLIAIYFTMAQLWIDVTWAEPDSEQKQTRNPLYSHFWSFLFF
jgi:hypothetical protein